MCYQVQIIAAMLFILSVSYYKPQVHCPPSKEYHIAGMTWPCSLFQLTVLVYSFADQVQRSCTTACGGSEYICWSDCGRVPVHCTLERGSL